MPVLPAEVILLIAQLHLVDPDLSAWPEHTVTHDYSTLDSMSKTCRAWNTLINPVLYRDIRLNYCPLIYNLMITLTVRNKALAVYVETLCVEGCGREDNLLQCRLLKAVPSLKRLVLREEAHSNFKFLAAPSTLKELYLTFGPKNVYDRTFYSELRISQRNWLDHILRNLPESLVVLGWRDRFSGHDEASSITKSTPNLGLRTLIVHGTAIYPELSARLTYLFPNVTSLHLSRLRSEDSLEGVRDAIGTLFQAYGAKLQTLRHTRCEDALFAEYFSQTPVLRELQIDKWSATYIEYKELYDEDVHASQLLEQLPATIESLIIYNYGTPDYFLKDLASRLTAPSFLPRLKYVPKLRLHAGCQEDESLDAWRKELGSQLKEVRGLERHPRA